MKREPDNFALELNTVWKFLNRGKWATHNAKYRGNFSPYVPRNLILRYSQEGDLVLDQFAGSGTTLIEARLLNRHGFGVDINPKALALCRQKCDFDAQVSTQLKLASATNLHFLNNESVDFICTHPPYANIIKYSDGIANNLSLLQMPDFLNAFKDVAKESFRVLKPGKFCAYTMGDMRKNGCVQPLGFSSMNIFCDAGFTLKEIIIKEQFNCKATGFWKTNSIKHNFLLLAHEYIFVFKKERKV